MNPRYLGKANSSKQYYQRNHIDVLDGIRAIAILIVVWFHFWQQSWLIPVIGNYSIDWLPRNGSLLVDMMILLSGFCLFLPYARNMVYGDQVPAASTFYVKRASRIMPSYYFAIFAALFLFALPLNAYKNPSIMWKDIFTHVFFIHNYFYDTLITTKLNAVLWTVAVEMQFYLLFPLLARCFQKKPIATYCTMTLVGLLSSHLISSNFYDLNQALYTNHSVTFLSVFANGMLGAWAYISITKDKVKNKAEEFIYFLLTIGGLLLFKIMCDYRTSWSNIQHWQVNYRFHLSLLFLLILFGILMAESYFHWLLGNRLMKFIAGISFNLYIWHQYIAVKLKEFRIPYWAGDVPPNQSGDKVWQWKYMILCIVISFAVAIAATYLIEKPMAKIITNLYYKHKKNKA